MPGQQDHREGHEEDARDDDLSGICEDERGQEIAEGQDCYPKAGEAAPPGARRGVCANDPGWEDEQGEVVGIEME